MGAYNKYYMDQEPKADWQLRAMFTITGISLGIIISHFIIGGAVECWTL